MTIETQDTRMEAEIKDLGLNAPRVTKEQIDELMAKVTCSTYVVEDTTTTIAVAMLVVGEANFTLAMERTACIDKRNFNADLGAKYATENAMAAARSKLWELEGYALAKQLAVNSGSIDSKDMTYEDALVAVMQHKSIRRKHWQNGVTVFGSANEDSPTFPNLCIEVIDYVEEAYNPSDEDIEATDWEVIDDKPQEFLSPFLTVNS